MGVVKKYNWAIWVGVALFAIYAFNPAGLGSKLGSIGNSGSSC